jgi:hypothetical protein
MTHLTMTPLVSTIRVYDQPGGYENRRPYLGLMIVMHLTDSDAYLCGAIGKIDRKTRALGLAALRERGFTKVLVERHKRLKTIDLSALNAPSTEQ